MPRALEGLARWRGLIVGLCGFVGACGGNDAGVGELFVVNSQGHGVMVFDGRTGGGPAPLRTLGSRTLLGRPAALAFDAAHDELLVANGRGYTVTSYARGAEGNAPPLRVLSGPATGLNEPVGITIDEVHDEIVVGNYGGVILVYPRTAGGEALPLRAISGPATGLVGGRIRVAVDVAHDEILALNDGSLTVSAFPRTATGDTAPSRTLSLLSTKSLPLSLAVDEKNGEIVVGTATSVLVYARTAAGDAAPLRTVAGAATGIDSASGVAVDSAHDELFVTNNLHGTVTVHARTADGDAAPLRTLAGLAAPAGIALDAAHDEIFVGTSDVDHSTGVVHARTAAGNVAPRRVLGSAPQLAEPGGLATDPSRGEVFVTSGGNDAVFVFAMAGDSGAAPLRVLSGPTTALATPVSAALDLDGGELFVGNSASSAVTVYDRAAGGDAAPRRTLGGASTGLGVARGLAVDVANDELIVLNYIAPSGFAHVPRGEIVFYPRHATGDVAPLRKITGGDLGSGQCLAFDADRGELLVGVSGPMGVVTYARAAVGEAAPLRTLAGEATTIFSPRGIGVDASSDQIFVANDLPYETPDFAITVFARTAAGAAPPLWTIAGRGAGLNFPGAATFVTRR